MHVSHGRSGQPSEQRTATFTGTVHMDPVLNAPDVMINTVVFTPGARTHWHRHPGGQLLVVTAGRGVVATRDGDTEVVTSGDVDLGRARRGALARRLRRLAADPHGRLARHHRVGRRSRGERLHRRPAIAEP